MKPSQLIFATLLTLTAAAAGAQGESKAEKGRVLIDLSSAALIDSAGAKAILAEALTPKIRKLYPAKKWGLVSEVAGGFTPANVCVVTARVMLAPLSARNHVLLMPEARTMVFDAMPGASQDQCHQLAKDKLRQATDALVSNLVKS